MTPTSRSIAPLGQPNPLRRCLAACRSQFLSIGVFSGVVNALQLTVSLYMMQVFDRVLATRNTDTLLYLTLIAIMAIGVLAILEGVRARAMQRIGTWIERKVAPESFARAVENELRGQPYSGEAMRDLASCRSYLTSPAALALYDVPWVPIYLAVIFALHPMLGWLSLAGAGLLLGLTLLSEAATARPLRDANTAAIASQRRLDAMLRNSEVIDSMGMLPAAMSRWQQGLATSAPAMNRAADRAALLLSVTKFFRLAVQVAILGAGAYLTLEQQLTSGASIAASIIMGRALAPVEQLIGGWKQLVQARQSYRRLTAFLAMPRLRPDGLPLPRPKGALTAERVTFAFPGSNTAMIKAVNFALEPGESLAVVGPSAAGKTTLIRLLTGTLQPNGGAIRLDGADVFLWNRQDFGQYVGYLPQDVELFDGTVFANIARLAEASPEAVYAAAQLAGCHEMILRLPRGYETEIGIGGQHLSGGQKQMIGLARALYGDPSLVILDEPNSNLDGDAEIALSLAIQELKKRGKTVVVVSHRPGLVQGVDKMLLLRDGAVELFGPRVEVLKRLMGANRPQPAPVAPTSREAQA